MRKVSFGEMRCSLARSLDRIGDWWTPLIVRDVFLGVNHFDQLVEDLGISRNLLTSRLNALVEKGILERRAYQARPLRHEYLLTAAGRDLVPALLALTAWGDRWAAPKEGVPMLVRHDRCGGVGSLTVCCAKCGEPLVAEHVSLLPGPGGAERTGTRIIAQKLATAR
ncbi:winged helix-turn-helix transcriptional regulator [Brucella anthropi]|uniref:winged helix-turn-helix transcriptional regulator n=1 Tax=Brucella anthropi TaxID=529 RepID=UPI0021577FF1|nr:helix-turn-helix domain-containing protein [Brucella anthropi]MCR8492664.1 helix-turn-helix transcriptional regulator [Brucella anthropi]